METNTEKFVRQPEQHNEGNTVHDYHRDLRYKQGQYARRRFLAGRNIPHVEF